MVHGNAFNSYQKAQVYDEMDPKKIILLLYEGAIKRIVLAREGIKNKNVKQRGENLGKAIAIIAELNASLDENIKTEEINFLKGLYVAMLTELPKVSVTEDIKTLDRAEKYLVELKRIWVTTVINNSHGNQQNRPGNQSTLTNKSQNKYMKIRQTYQSGSIAI
ncbi:MAG: flagellar export chaperone FliS [Deltaproteobacteria bacterium]|nr:flagellar export chaperone FliS [Deltaproteobacteria bacterium]